MTIGSVAVAEGGRNSIRRLWDESFPLGGDLFSEIDNADISLDLHRERASALVGQFLEKLASAREAGRALRLSKTPHENGASETLRIFKIGGGLRRRQIETALDKLHDSPGLESANDSKHSCRIDWYAPADLAFWDQDAQESVAQFPLLAVAHGLSVHREQWPKVNSLDEIEGVRAHRSVADEPSLASHNRG